MFESREALAALYESRGDVDLAAGRPGSAMLWFAESVDRVATAGRKAKLATARGRATDRIRFAVDWAVLEKADVPGGVGGLRRSLRAALARGRPGFMTLAQGDTDFVARLTVASTDFRERRTGVDRYSHSYRIPHEVPNPDIPPARRRWLVSVHRLERLLSERWQECSSCNGRGWRRCGSCSGRGWRPCSRCGGRKSVECRMCSGNGERRHKGRMVRCPTCHGDGRDVCPRCNHRGSETCSTCGGRKQLDCTWCGGTGRRARHSEFEIDRCRGEARGLRRRLHGLPVTITEYEDATWPYTVETYEKHAAIDIQLTIHTAGEDDQLIFTHAVGTSTRRTDRRTIGANPAIGLAVDELYLPADSAMAEHLFGPLATDAAARIIHALLSRKLEAARARSATARASGKPEEAFEADVDAMLLMQAIDPPAARAMEKKLRGFRRPDIPKIAA